MAQTSQNGPNSPKWSKIPKVAQMAQTTQNGLNDPKWSKRPQGPNGPNGPECSKVIQAAQDGPKWPYMTQRGQNSPKWSRVDQSGPLWQIPTQESPIWINTNPGRQFIIAHIRREDGDVLSSRWLSHNTTSTTLLLAPLLILLPPLQMVHLRLAGERVIWKPGSLHGKDTKTRRFEKWQ